MRALLGALIAISLFLSAAPALAASRDDLKFDVWDKLMTVANPSYDVSVGTGENTIAQKIGNAINLGLALLGTVAVILLIYAGYLWMMSGGNDDQITKAKTIVKQVVVGLIVLSLAYAIVSFTISWISPSSPPTQVTPLSAPSPQLRPGTIPE